MREESSDFPIETGLRRWELRFFVAESFVLIAALSAVAGIFLRRGGQLSRAAFFAALILIVPFVLLPVQSVVSRLRRGASTNIAWMIGVAILAASGVALLMIVRT